MRDAIPRDSVTTESDRPILAAEAISKSFGGVAALKDVRFELRAGEIHALMGENGAGKSTLMKVLSGVYTDYEGAVRVDGETVRDRKSVV